MANIVKTDGVLGGKARLEGRRISVLQITERVLELEQEPEFVADQLDISLGAVYSALAYYYEHPDEMREEQARLRKLESELRDDATDSPEPVDH